jgi:hypothetical protein
MNAMAQAMQLRNLQESSQMNALKARESSEMNALLRQQREATTEKSKYDLEQAKKKEERDAVDFRLKQFNDQFPAYSIGSEEDVEARITAMANDQILGPLSTRFGPLEDTIARNKAEFRRDPRNYVARLSGVSADKILEAADARENAAFSQDQLNRAINKQPLISAILIGALIGNRAQFQLGSTGLSRINTTATPSPIVSFPDGTEGVFLANKFNDSSFESLFNGVATSHSIASSILPVSNFLIFRNISNFGNALCKYFSAGSSLSSQSVIYSNLLNSYISSL